MINVKELKELTKNLTLLYVEDEEYLRISVETYLRKFFGSVVSASNGQEGLDAYKKGDFDIIISDIQMPIMNGLEMAEEIKSINPYQEIIIASAYGETVYFMEAIRIGVNGYIIKPIDYAQMNQELYKSTLKISSFKENVNYKKNLEKMVQERTEKILLMEDEKTKNFENTILSFVEMIEDRDTYTGGHSQRVADYSKLIAQDMGHSEEECELLYGAAIMHDIGKIATPDTILLKPGKLNQIEHKLIQEHARVGYEILHKIPMYKKHAEIILYHHERYDGKGYPSGKAGDNIPMLSHILMAADAFDAMTTNRIYKGRKSVKEATDEIKTLSGKQFHPKVIDSLVNAMSKIDIDEKVVQLPKTEIEKERFSYFFKDQLTNAYNREYLNFVLEKNVDNQYVCINKINLHGFNVYNNKYGWDEGDIFLKKIVDYLYQKYPKSTIFRIHGDDFVLINKEHTNVYLDEFQEIDFIKKAQIEFSNGHFDLGTQRISSLRELEAALSFTEGGLIYE